MTTQFKLSMHAVEKHLNVYDVRDVHDVHISKFHNKRLMDDCVRECLDKPDEVKQKGKRTEVTKSFDYDIGILGGYARRYSNRVKVVYRKTRRRHYVITAYPIAPTNEN